MAKTKQWYHSTNGKNWYPIVPKPHSIVANLEIAEGKVWSDEFGNYYTFKHI